MGIRVITLPIIIGVMVIFMASLLGCSQNNKAPTTKGTERLVNIKENIDDMDLGSGLPLGTFKEDVFNKLNKSETDIVRNVYLKGDNGFVYRISKGSESIDSLYPEKYQITVIFSEIEPVSKEEIVSIFGEDYESKTIYGNEMLAYRYKKSEKKNLLLLFEENEGSGYFTSTTIQFEPIWEKSNSQKK